MEKTLVGGLLRALWKLREGLFAALVPCSVAGQGGVAANGEAVADKQRLVQALAARGDLARVGVAVRSPSPEQKTLAHLNFFPGHFQGDAMWNACGGKNETQEKRKNKTKWFFIFQHNKMWFVTTLIITNKTNKTTEQN